MYSIIFYTNHRVNDSIFSTCLSRVSTISRLDNAELIVVSWKPVAVENNIILRNLKSCHMSLYTQILAGLQRCKYNKIFLVEHDVLYPRDHFKIEATPGKYTYNSNVYHLTKEGFFKAASCNFLSTLITDKETLLKGINEKIDEIKTIGRVSWAEFGNPDIFVTVHGENPVVDIRHGNNFTAHRSSLTYLDSIDYWNGKESYSKFWN